MHTINLKNYMICNSVDMTSGKGKIVKCKILVCHDQIGKILVNDNDNVGGCTYVASQCLVKSLYLHLIFVVNLKLL